jgi:putative addiction module killer protein
LVPHGVSVCGPARAGQREGQPAFGIPHEFLRGERAPDGLRAAKCGETRGIARIGLKQRPEIADAVKQPLDDDESVALSRKMRAYARPGGVETLSPIVDTIRLVAYGLQMIEVRETGAFSQWLSGLRDARAKAEIARRVRRLALGNPGDVKPVGAGVSELRIHYGPGYRVYYVQRGDLLIVLLCGGDKRAQANDIALALKLANEV